MLARILVPLDGSLRAERAIPVAAKVARATGGTILLVRVVTSPTVYGPAFVPPPAGIRSPDEIRLEVAAYLTQVAGLPVLSGITTQTVTLTGQPADALLRAIDTLNADIVILTSHGRTGRMRWVLGSVAQHLARHADVPILVLRESGPSPMKRGTEAEYPLRALVPLDGSPAAESALPYALHLITALAAPAQAALHLTLVVSPSEADKNNMPDALMVRRERLSGGSSRQIESRAHRSLHHLERRLRSRHRRGSSQSRGEWGGRSRRRRFWRL